MSLQDYRITVGLEVHVELKTKSKIFCSCPTTFGAAPNTAICPVCAGLPGALPTLNRRAVELATIAALALNAEISPLSRMDRKHYFYPDLPKAYQISQAEYPIGKNGSLRFLLNGEERYVRIERIHIEEDAGKLTHEGEQTHVDLNRCGVPLIEIVSAPELHSPEEASAYLRMLRETLVACGVSDCRMQEGQFRCDVNLSLAKRGESQLGVRTEIKNINSFAFVEKAIAHEATRQAAELDAGRPIQRQTRRFDTVSGTTRLMRIKETEADYRFFPEPDLPPFRLSKDFIERLRREIPELPHERAVRFSTQYGLPDADSAILNADLALSDFFESAASLTTYPRILSNLILTDLLRLRGAGESFVSPVTAPRLASLCTLLGGGEINASTAKKLLVRMAKEELDPAETVKREELAVIRDSQRLQELAQRAMRECTRAVADYRNGKKAALRAIEGKAMALSGGRAEPILLEELLLTELDKGE